jgi:hypothetical protein
MYEPNPEIAVSLSDHRRWTFISGVSWEENWGWRRKAWRAARLRCLPSNAGVDGDMHILEVDSFDLEVGEST